MDIGQAKAGILLGTQVFNEYFRELYVKGLFVRTIDFELPNRDLTVSLAFDPPFFHIRRRDDGETYTCVTLYGTLEVRSSDDPEGPPIKAESVEVDAIVNLVLRPKSGGAAPVLGLAYEGVDGTPPDPLQAEHIARLFNRPGLTTVIAQRELDIVTPLIEMLEGTYFDAGNRPPRDHWPLSLRLWGADGEFEESCAGIFAALPGEDPDPGDMPSPLPAYNGFGTILSRSLLNDVLEKSAAAAIGGSLDDLGTIESLSMTMEDQTVAVSGSLRSAGDSISFAGPARFLLPPGYEHLCLDTEDVRIDDSSHAVQAIFSALRFSFRIHSISGAKVFGEHALPEVLEIDKDAKDLESGLVHPLTAGLEALADGMRTAYERKYIVLDSAVHGAVVRDGALLQYAQVFISKHVDELLQAVWFKRYREWGIFTLKSGRAFRGRDLARLMGKQKIKVIGYHSVKSLFIRANPDGNRHNNLRYIRKEI